jgi:hypothetical protein
VFQGKVLYFVSMLRFAAATFYKEKFMSTAEIAKGLTDLCRQNKNMEAIEKYYSDGIVSVESSGGPAMPAEMKGIEAIKGNELHNEEVNGPFLGENQFAVEFKMDVTQKASGKRMHMEEMALYTVEGGKIVREHFFYNAGA